MKIVWKIIAAVVIIVIVIFVGVRVYQRIELQSQQAKQQNAEMERPTVVVKPAERSDVRIIRNISGQIEASVSVDIVPKVSGRIEVLMVDEGDTVTKTSSQVDVIAQLDKESFEAAVMQADAALAVANANLQRAQVNVNDKERELKRMENLFEQGSTTEQQRDLAMTAAQAAQAELALAEAQVKQAKASLEQAKISLKECTIITPLEGEATVSKKYLEAGDMANPQQPIVTLIQDDFVKVVVGVSERDIPLIETGKTKATIQVDAYSEKTFEGTVCKISPTVDMVTRTAEVEIHIPNEDKKLKAGMFARVGLVVKEKDGVLVISDDAVLREGDKTYVFVVNDGVAHKREINLGIAEGVKTEVTEGLQEGERVVIQGQSLLEDDMQVDIAVEDVTQ